MSWITDPTLTFSLPGQCSPNKQNETRAVLRSAAVGKQWGKSFQWRDFTYSQNFYSPNLNEKNLLQRGKPHIQAAEQPVRGERICVLDHTFLQIPGKKYAPSVTGESIDKTAGVRFLRYSRLAWKMLISPVNLSGSSCYSPLCHPCSMTLSAFSHCIVHMQREICIFTMSSPTGNFPFVFKDNFTNTLCYSGNRRRPQEEKEQPHTLKCHSWVLLCHLEALSIFCASISH